MRLTAHYGTLLVFVYATLALGCGTSGVDPSDSDGGPCEGEDCGLALELGTLDDTGSFRPHVEGELFPWRYGFQGGTMIMPVFRLDPAQVRENDTVLLALRHEADPERPDLLGEAADFPSMTVNMPVWRTGAGELVVGPVLDQIGWGALDGVRLTFSAELTAAGRTGSLTRRLALTSGEPIPDASCAPFAVEDTGCAYRVFEGVATVTAIVAPSGSEYSCDDGQRVEVELALDDAVNADACLASMGAVPELTSVLTIGAGALPSRACVEAAGITVGATYPVRLMRQLRGTCSPVIVWVDTPLDTDCSCL